MPFTISHAAAALPFRRLGLVPSALVVGTLAPDFEYFLLPTRPGGFGHTYAGALLFTLPLALMVLWTFHAVVKVPLVRLFPDGFRRRLNGQMGRFRFGGRGRFALIVVSALLGIATHVAWDSLTHSYTWPYRHIALLRDSSYLPVLGWYPNERILQHTSTLGGMLALGAWVLHWYRTTQPRKQGEDTVMVAAHRWAVLGAIAGTSALAGCAAAVRAMEDGGRVIADSVIMAIAWAWWAVVFYSILYSGRRASRSNQY
jgi:hypothetical protein